MFRRALALMLVLGLVACAPKITKGTIVEKGHEDARSWTSTSMIPVGKTFIFQTQHHHDDEDWVIIIEGVDEEDKVVRQRFEVTEELWEELEVGDYFDATPTQEVEEPLN